MNELKIFNNEEFGKIRITEINGKTYFVAKDIANALGYSNPRDAISRHCKGVVKHDNFKEGGREVSLIPEGDIYRLVIKSQLPSADKFESWIFDEVLPQLRKTGSYTMEDKPKLPTTYKEALQELLKQVEENEKLAIENQQMQPKAQYFDELVDRKLNLSLRDTAKELGVRQKDFVKFLLDNKFIFRTNKKKIRAYADYCESGKGYFVLKEFQTDNHADVQTLVTPRGREAFNLMVSAGKQHIKG